MVELIAKLFVIVVELLALGVLGISFLILPDAADRFLLLISAPVGFLFLYTLFDALLR